MSDRDQLLELIRQLQEQLEDTSEVPVWYEHG
jgi:hypothetical protein